jgi:two-component system, chemotaxis family, chemotaxis protein CheY
MKILILEDDYTSSAVLQKILNQYGEVTVTSDGFRAIEEFKKSLSNDFKYDLICLDIMVPQIDGQEVLRMIRAEELKAGRARLKDRSQIIMITALNDIENVMSSFTEQAEGYIIKPFSKEKISKTLLQLKLI